MEANISPPENGVHLREAAPHRRPQDWPEAGPIDLAVHDLPHASSLTEWWYLNTHFETADGRHFSLFASFFRIVQGRDEETDLPIFAHSLTWALCEPEAGLYRPESLIDPDSPRIGLEKLARGEGAQDPHLRRALREVLEKGEVPLPDRLLSQPVHVALDRLDLNYDGNRFWKDEAGRYHLELKRFDEAAHCSLIFTPQKPAIRHGTDGVVKGTSGEDMFYYFISRCDLAGQLEIDGETLEITRGDGWYDHEFGGQRPESEEIDVLSGFVHRPQEIAWNWLALQLDDGTELTAYTLAEIDSGERIDARAIVIGPDGERSAWTRITLEPIGEPWRSTRTFNEYPVAWKLEVPAAAIALELHAQTPDQEVITLISKPSFWEGRCTAIGEIDGNAVTGRAWLERSGYAALGTLDQFFKAVSVEVRKSLAQMLPFALTETEATPLVASDERPEYMDGVATDQLSDSLIRPIREIADRGGKAWRSYAALACCDAVGGDSREYAQWLAMPELLHVGSLIVDDVQDRSANRRGGPTAHLVYGEPLAINAGTACYFLTQKLLVGPVATDAMKVRLYDLYFQAMRAGHAGQALDLAGLADELPGVVTSGDAAELERRVLAIHRLKTAAPADCLARMGAHVGGGSDEQIEALGQYFQGLGLAFQIVDDILNLRGFKGDLKDYGEDIAHGKVTLPIAKAMGVLEPEPRARLAELLLAQSDDPARVQEAIEIIEDCGALDACDLQARALIDEAWKTLDPVVPDSLYKIMLRAFSWYVLERHY